MVKSVPKKGRGVFALKDFKEGEIIESAPAKLTRTVIMVVASAPKLAKRSAGEKTVSISKAA